MRILMLAQSFSPIVGGEERVVEDLSIELAKRGHAVSIATLQQRGDSLPAETAGVPVHPLRSTAYRITKTHRDAERRHAPPAPDPETVIDLRRVLRRERPQVVHAHNWIIHSHLPLNRRHASALVLSLHDYGLICATKRLRRREELCSGPGNLKCLLCAAQHYGPTRGVVAAVATRSRESALRRAVDVFLPVSSTVEDLCQMRADDLSRVIPNFIGELPPSPPASDPRLRQLPDRPFILFFGDATVDKGAWCLAQAYKALADPPPLVLVGRSYIDELAMRPGIHVLGPWPRALTIEAVRRSMFTVAPSLWPEPFGLVALESAAVGKPTIASDIGGLRDIVLDGVSGLLVAPGDQSALASAMGRLIAEEGLRAQLGEAARSRAALFSPEAIVPRFEEAYRLAIVKRRAGRNPSGI
jgi:glycosyltransferase involved in cell wall biosynthesis